MATKNPIQVGFDVIIDPSITQFKHGNTPRIQTYQRVGTVGYVERVDGEHIEVNFGEAHYCFAAHELLDAPRELPTYTPRVSAGGGMKYDKGKPRMELLVQGCPNAMEQVATVLTFGAEKYAAHSWQTVPNGDDRYLAALLRHLTAIGKGEQADPESGLSHLAHVACNALFILELECQKKTGASDAEV